MNKSIKKYTCVNRVYPRHEERLLPCRVILLAHLAVSLGHVFLLEQPSSARFGDLPRWRKFVEDFVYVPGLHPFAELKIVARSYPHDSMCWTCAMCYNLYVTEGLQAKDAHEIVWG